MGDRFITLDKHQNHKVEENNKAMDYDSYRYFRAEKKMMNILAYAGCIHRFQLNDNGYVQINIFGYDVNTGKICKYH